MNYLSSYGMDNQLNLQVSFLSQLPLLLDGSLQMILNHLYESSYNLKLNLRHAFSLSTALTHSTKRLEILNENPVVSIIIKKIRSKNKLNHFFEFPVQKVFSSTSSN